MVITHQHHQFLLIGDLNGKYGGMAYLIPKMHGKAYSWSCKRNLWIEKRCESQIFGKDIAS